MRNHPGVPMTIYDIQGVVKEAWLNAMTPRNITKGFEVSGIHPLNSHILFNLSQIVQLNKKEELLKPMIQPTLLKLR